jgi:ribonuclease HI
VRCRLYSDGGTRGGNPGVSASGFVVWDSTNTQIIYETADLIPHIVSNNFAEYLALASGLHWCANKGYTHVDCFLDAQVVTNHMNGTYAVKSKNLIECFEGTKAEESRIPVVTYTWIPRKLNSRADGLVRTLLDVEMERLQSERV